MTTATSAAELIFDTQRQQWIPLEGNASKGSPPERHLARLRQKSLVASTISERDVLSYGQPPKLSATFNRTPKGPIFEPRSLAQPHRTMHVSTHLPVGVVALLTLPVTAEAQRKHEKKYGPQFVAEVRALPAATGRSGDRRADEAESSVPARGVRAG